MLVAAALESVAGRRRARGHDRRRARSPSSCRPGRGSPATSTSASDAEGRRANRRFVVRIRRGAAARVLARAAPAARDAARRDGDGLLHIERRRAASSRSRPSRGPPAGLVPLGALAEAGRPRVRLAAQRARPRSGPTSSRRSPSGRPRTVGRHPRHPLGGRRRPADARRAGRRAGDDLHRPERVRRALRPRALPAAGQPALRRGAPVARQPRPRRSAPRRGVHQARARRRRPRLRARLDRALAPHAARRDTTSPPPRCCSTCSAKARSSTCCASSSGTRPTPRPRRPPGSRTATSAGTSTSASPTSARRLDPTPTSGTPRRRGRGPRGQAHQPLRPQPVLTESLTLMARRSLQPADLADAGHGLRGLMQTMERNRIRRLRAAGFDEPHRPLTSPTCTRRTSCRSRHERDHLAHHLGSFARGAGSRLSSETQQERINHRSTPGGCGQAAPVAPLGAGTALVPQFNEAGHCRSRASRGQRQLCSHAEDSCLRQRSGMSPSLRS